MDNQVLIQGFIVKWNNTGYDFKIKTKLERFNDVSYSLEIKSNNWANNLHLPFLLQELDEIISNY